MSYTQEQCDIMNAELEREREYFNARPGTSRSGSNITASVKSPLRYKVMGGGAQR